MIRDSVNSGYCDMGCEGASNLSIQQAYNFNFLSDNDIAQNVFIVIGLIHERERREIDREREDEEERKGKKELKT